MHTHRSKAFDRRNSKEPMNREKERKIHPWNRSECVCWVFCSCTMPNTRAIRIFNKYAHVISVESIKLFTSKYWVSITESWAHHTPYEYNHICVTVIHSLLQMHKNNLGTVSREKEMIFSFQMKIVSMQPDHFIHAK